ncbi:methylenetetrahydrofolate reductase [Buchnera aphidicola]|uniref:methylenetetrahydrofolate reductase n=1 Tax=Buchnera aphidicola TaxID=9 RepID=UPI00094C58ED|nr:methylenetetrahydrofolate reductase [Buchnera aphidicola]
MVTIINNDHGIYNTESYNLKNKIKISFEVFPPKDIFLEKKLFNSVQVLNSCYPEFFSVTNSTHPENRYKTFSVIKKIRSLINSPVCAHLTSIGFDEVTIKEIAAKYWKCGVKKIIALRGDLPNQYSNNIIYAVDLIKLLKSVNNFEILVAAYPEIHPESRSLQEDLINLKNKIHVGAKKAITQFFFSIDKFLSFRDSCLSFGIEIDLIPGILPILNIDQLKKFAAMTRVYIPRWIFDAFEKNKNDLEQCQNLSVGIAMNLIISLYRQGVTCFHLYTLNQSYLSLQICQRLGLV